MSNGVRTTCAGHDGEASLCEKCIDIQTGMLFVKARTGSSDPGDVQCKVIRKIIALAHKEGVSRSTALQFFVEYREQHQTDDMEEWKRFEKSQQCRAMVQKHFSTRPVTPGREPPQDGQGVGLSRGLTRVMTSIERLGTWGNGKDDPRSSKRLLGWKANGLFGHSSSSPKASM